MTVLWNHSNWVAVPPHLRSAETRPDESLARGCDDLFSLPEVAGGLGRGSI